MDWSFTAAAAAAGAAGQDVCQSVGSAHVGGSSISVQSAPHCDVAKMDAGVNKQAMSSNNTCRQAALAPVVNSSAR